MARYERSGQDPYTDPRTGILRNKVGATDQATLDAREVEFTTARTFELTLRPEPGGFDLAHLRRIHARLFGDVYDWVGALRTVDNRIVAVSHVLGRVATRGVDREYRDRAGPHEGAVRERRGPGRHRERGDDELDRR